MKLLERDAQLAALNNALLEALAGAGRIALVSGEAGIGKTSLVEAFTNHQSNSVRVLWGVCDSLFTPRPLGPLHDMAAQFQGGVPDLLAADSNHTQLFAALLLELQRQPSILVFEDVHWADEASLDLLRYLARRIHNLPVMLVLTYRDDELAAQHPLRTLLGDMSSSSSARRIQLSPLSRQAVSTLLGDRRTDANALHRQTGGNPFFVTEVLASEDSGIPATIRDAVLARTARLSLSGRAVLEAAAVIGMRIEPWLLDAVTGAEADAVDESIAAGILRAQGDMLTFRHELSLHTILENIPPHRKLVLHRLVLEALKQPPSAHKDLARLAHHAGAANDREAVSEYAPAAAQHAAAAGAHREAAALYTLALRFDTHLQAEQLATILGAYARECNLTEQYAEAIAALRRAAEIWARLQMPQKQGEALAAMAIMLRTSGKNAEAERINRSVISMLEELPPCRELALAYRVQATLTLSQREIAEAIQWGERAIELAKQFGDRNVLSMAYTMLGSAWLFIDFERGQVILEKHLESALAAGNETPISNLYAYIGSCAAELYQLRYAQRKLVEGIAFTTERDLDIFTHLIQAWQALALVHLGQWDEAGQITGFLSKKLSPIVVSRIPALAAIGLLQVRSGRGQPDAALDEALRLAEGTGTLQHLGLARIVRAEAAWLQGDYQRTRAEARAAYDLALSKKHAWLAGELAFWRWRGGDQVPILDWMALPFALQIKGDWQGAAAEWERIGCPYEQARALADGDAQAKVSALEIFERLGALPAAAQLRETLRASGAAKLPRQPRPSTRQNPFGLTARQVDILALLVEGLSNAEIAARLHISPKTTDHHVSAILRRLEVHSRESAADLARQHPAFNQK